ncbi:MAG TPA: GNAT family N-acetyltransferase [Gemmatimonadaceae bacterium]|nr:GNAT family N-acetyltransferase [Gemmatimonadaceae bacterium]
MLDNPIWSALTTAHAHFAEGDDLARRYPPEVTPLAGLIEQSPEAYAALAKLMPVGGQVGFFRDVLPDPPDGWATVTRTRMYQMHCATPRDMSDDSIEILGTADVPAMAELAQLTEPGPFGPRTIEFGTFYGIRDQGRLVAMTGERIHPGRYAEVSAVCTHPDYRGRGYAAALVAAATRGIIARGDLAMLHVRCDNPAVRVYEHVGYTSERMLELLIVRRTE